MDKSEWQQMIQTLHSMGFHILEINEEEETLLICPTATR